MKISLQTKKRLLLGLLIVITIWPLAHFAVVRTFDLNPWKWFGWAMYTVPSDAINIYVIDDAGQRVPLHAAPPRLRQRLADTQHQFSTRLLQFGPGPSPDALAQVLFRAFPSHRRLRIYVQHVEMNRQTAMYEQVRMHLYTYERDAAGQPVLTDSEDVSDQYNPDGSPISLRRVPDHGSVARLPQVDRMCLGRTPADELRV